MRLLLLYFVCFILTYICMRISSWLSDHEWTIGYLVVTLILSLLGPLGSIFSFVRVSFLLADIALMRLNTDWFFDFLEWFEEVCKRKSKF